MKRIPEHPHVVFLGAGGMGRVAIETAAAFEGVGEIVVADLDAASAEAVVARCAASSRTKMRAVSIDVTDAAALGELLRPADVVLNTTGPFYRLGVPVLRGAIDAGCHYLDICDDWEPTLEMLALDDAARSQGVLAVIGMGASPGLSNLMARQACERLDRVDDLYTAWPIDGGNETDDSLDEVAEAGGGMSAALLHWMQQISGEIQVVEGGQLVSRSPLAPVDLDFPGVGKGTAYTVGHPEPITLRERMRVQGKSANLMLLKPSTAAFLRRLRDDMDAGKLSLEAAAAQVLDPGVTRQAGALLHSLGCAGSGRLPFFFALARGMRDGRPLTIGVRATSIPTGMDGVTGIPLALGLRQLLDGRMDQAGVHPPESVIAPAPLFDALAPSCQPPASGFDELIVLSEAES
ncbi:MAG: saccharopine dehydrogenase NADP-binding domain-containing protein [Myxococcota bacterium]|nr:saccharopine dehydrogenase NADP-binding domain-containing protein [Myxococcota bacterium]